MANKHYSHLFWDWNGTLLDDVDWCIAQMNRMLAKRGIEPIAGRRQYGEIFDFPVIDYYKKAGFDLEAEPFEALAVEFIDLYHAKGSGPVLHPGAEKALAAVAEAGLCQVILSATDRENLSSQMKPFGIDKYFSEILGISDIYATGKVEIGLEYIRGNSVPSGVLIGDTVHDFEVAQRMGLDCVLVACGHQSRRRLEGCGVPVAENPADALKYVL